MAFPTAVVRIVAFGALPLAVCLASHASTTPGLEPVRYDRDIRPLLTDRCFRCHGPDASSREADLRLDLRDWAIEERDGAAAIVPGDLAASLLWERVSSHDPADRMPPKKSNKKHLSESELELVRRWIEQGAPYEPHWSFVAPTQPDPPAVRDASWCRAPIDRFVLARLERDGIAPSPEADPETLLRRAFHDLTGLPPTPEEIASFRRDLLVGGDTDVFAAWVDRLLDEEPYRSRHAERMAQPWLDAARYADTAGIHMDAGRQMWLWRDWVLGAYRSNMPFDQFVTEQLAGDLMPEATESQRIASGFNRNHVTSDEGGAIAEEYLVEYAVDRAATTGSVLLGLTVGCARCHDHKFDPLSQEEFYSFLAYFNSIEEPGLYSQTTDPNRAHEPFLVAPTASQRAERSAIDRETAAILAELDRESPGEHAARDEFFAALPKRAGVTWHDARVQRATSLHGATLSIQPDGSVLALGQNPDIDEHRLELVTDATDLRLFAIEAIADPTMPEGRVGRAFNGNAVLSGVSAKATSIADPSRTVDIAFDWVWADVEQQDGDYRAVNVIELGDRRGWAVDAHRRPGNRVLVLRAAEPFGFSGGTRVDLGLEYVSPYAAHTLGRVRVHLGRLGDAGTALLPVTASAWHVVGPFPGESTGSLFDTPFGPEEGASLDRHRNFGAGNQYWRVDLALADERLNKLADGVNVTYVGKVIYSPTAREVPVSLGSDDGVRLFVNGVEAFSRNVERGLAANQDRTTVALREGANAVVLKIVNSGGNSGFYWRASPTTPDELRGDLVAGLLPTAALAPELATRATQAWRTDFLPSYVQKRDKLAALRNQATAIDAMAPRTMVMKELPQQRETFVLKRGQYDLPDRERPVRRGVPAALGAIAEAQPQDRLELARWMVSDQNPLVARVAVNRLWETLFGAGLVRTSEDFGMQGEWPSHPELLDWLAVEFRESGWDVGAMIKSIVTSATYRQDSRVRDDLRDRDPENRLLAFYPRRRLGAEQIRDQALYVAGLLVEQLGGPSVKPYQPEGLWQEVAMPGSNTRIFERGEGVDLWRRGIYTYWKRAAPPPSMLTFDAPTRESCTVRRAATNTPLQALVLMNDPQFVEAARVLAERTLREASQVGVDDAAADDAGIATIFRRCVGRAPDAREHKSLVAALATFRDRYRNAPDDAAHLVAIGEAPVDPAIDVTELAAWTMIASAVMNTHASVTQR